MRGWLVGLLTLTMAIALLPGAVSARATGGEYELTVVFQGNALPAGAQEALEKAGAKVESTVPQVGMIQARGQASLIPTLQKLPGVQYVAPSLIWQLQVEQKLTALPAATEAAAAAGDLYQRYQWDIKQVTEDGASWSVDRGSHGTVVGIIDTGVYQNHADLKANFMGGRNFVPAGAGGDPSETGDPGDIADRAGHGSHVAGTIAGNGRIYGVGPGLGFRSYRVFGASGGAQTSWITAAMVAAADDGVDVISMSLGGYDVVGRVTWTDPSTGATYDLGDDHADLVAWKRAFEYVSDKDVVLVAAAGNDGIDAGNPKAVVSYLNAVYGGYGYHFAGSGYEVPGGIRGAVAVSATGPDRTLSSYSNFGRNFVTVAAPGGDFKRYPNGDWYTDMCLSSYMDTGDGGSHYVWMAGTSMATPKAAATVALFIDQMRSRHAGRPDPEESIRHLKSSAVKVSSKGAAALFGAGMLDAYRMLTAGAGAED